MAIRIDFSGVGASELTEEMARFLSRANCLDGICALTIAEHDDPPQRSIAESVCASSRARATSSLSSDAAGLLRIAWQTELASRFAVALDEPSLKRISAPTLPVNAYYAVFNCRRAFGRVAGTNLDRHNAVADDFAGRTRRLPLPWSLTLAGDPEDLETCDLKPPIVKPYSITPIERSHEPSAYAWAALRMARRWKVELARESWFNDRKHRKPDGSKRQRLPKGIKKKLALGLRPTTLYDFLWELRRRANYESSDEYGSDVGIADFARFHDGLVALLDAAMLIGETEIARRVGYEALAAAGSDWMGSARRAGAWATEPLSTRLEAIRAVV